MQRRPRSDLTNCHVRSVQWALDRLRREGVKWTLQKMATRTGPVNRELFQWQFQTPTTIFDVALTWQGPVPHRTSHCCPSDQSLCQPPIRTPTCYRSLIGVRCTIGLVLCKVRCATRLCSNCPVAAWGPLPADQREIPPREYKIAKKTSVYKLCTAAEFSFHRDNAYAAPFNLPGLYSTVMS